MLRFLLYPGVILHEFSHTLACSILGVKISKISFGINESYVKHENAGPVKMALIALAPFYLGIAIGMLLFGLAKNITYYDTLWFVLLNYLGICVLYYSVPSSQDTKNISEAMRSQMKKDWKKGVREKLIVLIKAIVLYLPIYIISQIVALLDKADILRVILVAVIAVFVYGI